MTTFDDREREEETRFKHELWLDFKARARRNKLFGLWVAEKMGLSPNEARAYADSLVMHDFTEPGHDDVLTKVEADLAARDIEPDHFLLKHKQDELMAKARQQIRGE